MNACPHRKLAGLAMKILPPASQPGFASQSYKAKKADVYRWLMNTLATMEVCVMIVMAGVHVGGQMLAVRFFVSCRFRHLRCVLWRRGMAMG